MRSKLTLLATAAVLAFGVAAPVASAEDAPGAKSDITIVGAEGAPPAGIEQGAEDQGAINRSNKDEGAPDGSAEDSANAPAGAQPGPSRTY
jgi:hypothetical protein